MNLKQANVQNLVHEVVVPLQNQLMAQQHLQHHQNLRVLDFNRGFKLLQIIILWHDMYVMFHNLWKLEFDFISMPPMQM